MSGEEADSSVAVTPRRRNIVLCSDGTGNRGGKARGTNVWAVFRGIERDEFEENGETVEQIAFYDDGVGTEKFIVPKLLGGAVGFGVNKNVRDLYTSLVRTYNPGDRIYLFGFSRGAYTVRALSGLIQTCGIICRDSYPEAAKLRKAVNDLYKAFRRTYFRSHIEKRLYENQAEPDVEETLRWMGLEICRRKVETIPFLGVWDTVEAIGLPFPKLADALNYVWQFRFPDNKPSPRVELACHALALDDERKTFHPVLWDETPDPEEETPASQAKVEQVWFSGVHSNVGGGYPKDQMAYVALDWMIDRAKTKGLRFREDFWRDIRGEADANGKLYDSRSGPKAWYRYEPRQIKAMCEKNGIQRPWIHSSVFRRIAAGTLGYAPAWIPDDVWVEGPDVGGLTDYQIGHFLRDTGADRAAALQSVRKRVCLRRWHYYLSAAWPILLVAFIVYAYAWNDCPTLKDCDAPGFVRGAIGVADKIVPKFLEGIVHPVLRCACQYWVLVLGLLVALGGLLLGGYLMQKKDVPQALDAWQPFRDLLARGAKGEPSSD